jgi:TolB-like protein
MLRVLGCVCLLLVSAQLARAADAPSVAVLPLQKAAASTRYDGLGRALAGMLVSDLSAVPGLRLVERDQLDALLTEIELQDSGFLDPKTAQKLGKGVGARFVVAGSFTVVDPTFALDARIVEVQTGEIVKAADAHGTVADFVSVEKDLVETLLAGLDLTLSSSERRKLLMQAPTERFSAFTAYGEGLARKEEGKLDEAKTAFARALAEDPQFADAQAALGDLEALVRRRQAERLGERRTARDEAFAALLAAVPDERTLPADFAYDQAAVARFALRLGVLEEQRRDCDRYAEMRHYLDRVAWNVAEPVRKPTDVGVLSYAISQLASAQGLDQRSDDPRTPEYLKDTLSSRSAMLFRNLSAYVFDGQTHYKRTHGLLSSLLACYAPRDALRELDGLVTAARAAGVAGVVVDRSGLPLTVEENLQVWWARTRAEGLGADAEMARRTEALLAAHRDNPDDERRVLQVVDEVLTLARGWEDHQVRRRALSPDEIARRMRLVADGKVAATPVCKQALTLRMGAAHWVEEYDRKVATPDNWLPIHVDTAFSTWVPASDFGCLEGVPARFSSPEAAWEWFDTARSRETTPATDGQSCAGAWIGYEQLLDQTRSQRQDPTVGPIWSFTADQMWAGLVYQRCAHE